MRKIFYYSLLLTFGYLVLESCNNKKGKDSLNTIKADTNKVWILHDSSHNNVYSNPVRAMNFAQQEKELAQTLNYARGIIRSLMDIGNVHWITGSYPDALEKQLKALELSEQINALPLKARCLGNMSIVYKDMNEFKEAIYYQKEAILIDSAYNDIDNLLLDYVNLGEFYETIDFGSSIHFQNKAYEFALNLRDNKRLKDTNIFGRIYLNLGKLDLSDEKDDPSLALQHFSSSIHYLIQKHDYHSLNQSFLGKAEIFQDKESVQGKKQFDSTFYYTDLALKMAEQGNYPLGTLNANLILYKLSKENHLPKEHDKNSTLKYLEAVRKSKDSIYSYQAALRTQSLTFGEQEREAIMKAAQEKQKKINADYVQFGAIALSVPFIFGLIILLGRIKVKPRVIESLGLFCLLLFFELITLVLHYFFEKINDEPIYMLAMLLPAAAALVPFHHKMQKLAMMLLSITYKKRKKPNQV